MQILQAHKYYWHRDGASNYALDLSTLLRKHGQTVIPFAMKHPQNEATPFEKYFVTGHALDNPTAASFKEKIVAGTNFLYSFEAKRNIARLIQEQGKIDIAHIHNIYHHISPSILPVLKKQGAKIVMSLHDYKLICPNYTMFHHGAVHEEDAQGWYTSCLGNKCMKNSRAQSALVTAEMIWQHKIWRAYERYVDVFLAPSRFMLNTCIRFGVPKEKIKHFPYFIDTKKFAVTTENLGYVAYVGRLSEEKGLHTLLDAAKVLPHIPFRIIGTGPLDVTLRRRVVTEGMENVVFTGFLGGVQLKKNIDGARLFVLPATWYENYPVSVLEAKSTGKMTIASRMGGLPEMIPENALFDAGNSKQLAERISAWYTMNADTRAGVGREARLAVEQINDPTQHAAEILSLYRSL